jgi:hypothetical protein
MTAGGLAGDEGDGGWEADTGVCSYKLGWMAARIWGGDRWSVKTLRDYLWEYARCAGSASWFNTVRGGNA